jgi:hypothetical protein
MASAIFRAFGVVSLRLPVWACGSDGAVSAMHVLICPIDSMPTSPLQMRLSRSGLSTAAVMAEVKFVNMFARVVFSLGVPKWSENEMKTRSVPEVKMRWNNVSLGG